MPLLRKFFKAAIESFRRFSRTTLSVIDQTGSLCGVCSIDQSENLSKKKAGNGSEDNQSITVGDIYNPKVSFVSSEQSLYEAFSKISQEDYSFLPVVNNHCDRNLLEIRGIIEPK